MFLIDLCGCQFLSNDGHANCGIHTKSSKIYLFNDISLGRKPKSAIQNKTLFLWFSDWIFEAYWKQYFTQHYRTIAWNELNTTPQVSNRPYHSWCLSKNLKTWREKKKDSVELQIKGCWIISNWREDNLCLGNERFTLATRAGKSGKQTFSRCFPG